LRESLQLQAKAALILREIVTIAMASNNISLTVSRRRYIVTIQRKLNK